VVAARLAAAATVIVPLVPVIVLLAPWMFGLQPPPPELLPFSATTGVAKATRKIAIVRRDIHLFMRSILSRCLASARVTSYVFTESSQCMAQTLAVSSSSPPGQGNYSIPATAR